MNYNWKWLSDKRLHVMSPSDSLHCDVEGREEQVTCDHSCDIGDTVLWYCFIKLKNLIEKDHLTKELGKKEILLNVISFHKFLTSLFYVRVSITASINNRLSPNPWDPSNQKSALVTRLIV